MNILVILKYYVKYYVCAIPVQGILLRFVMGSENRMQLPAVADTLLGNARQTYREA